MKTIIFTILNIILSILFILFALFFIQSISFEYNSDGNYFDENSMVNYHQQSILVYGMLTLFTLLIIFFINYHKIKGVKKNRKLKTSKKY